MKIKILIPNSGMSIETLKEREVMLHQAVSCSVELQAECISGGPVSIESVSDEIQAAPYILKEGSVAERDGFDALVIYCFSDPGVEALREHLSIPVIGPGEISLASADLFSERFTVITTTESNIQRTERRLKKNSVAREKMVAVRALDIPVINLREDADLTKKRLDEVCRIAVREDRVDTLVLGCLGLADYGSELEKKYGIMVLDPAFLAVGWAELAARLHRRSAGSAKR